MKNTVIIHIGVPKTGSTAIQKYLFNNSKTLKAIGLEYHNTHAVSAEDPDFWAHHLLAHKWGGWIDPKKFPISPDEAWDNLAKDVAKGNGRTIVISSERFSDLVSIEMLPNIMSFIQQKLYPARIKIFLYTRNQVELAESFYKQQVKVNVNRQSLESYLKRLPDFLNFSDVINRCERLIGKGNVIVRSYENDLKDGGVINGFLQGCGFELIEKLIPKTKTKKYNTSTSSLSTLIMANPDLKNIMQRNKYRHIIRKIFDDMKTFDGVEPTLLSKNQIDIICQKYNTANINLFKNYDIYIDLDKYKNKPHIKDTKYLLNSDRIIELLKVFNEDLIDLSKETK